jgi:hypothetical protein
MKTFTLGLMGWLGIAFITAGCSPTPLYAIDQSYIYGDLTISITNIIDQSRHVDEWECQDQDDTVRIIRLALKCEENCPFTLDARLIFPDGSSTRAGADLEFRGNTPWIGGEDLNFGCYQREFHPEKLRIDFTDKSGELEDTRVHYDLRDE